MLVTLAQLQTAIAYLTAAIGLIPGDTNGNYVIDRLQAAQSVLNEAYQRLATGAVSDSYPLVNGQDGCVAAGVALINLVSGESSAAAGAANMTSALTTLSGTYS